MMISLYNTPNPVIKRAMFFARHLHRSADAVR
jgi:hypothetical protein